MALSENYPDKCHQEWSYLHIYRRQIIILVVQISWLRDGTEKIRGLFTPPRVEHIGNCSGKIDKNHIENNIKTDIGPYIFKRSLNQPGCSEKWFWGEYIQKTSYIYKKLWYVSYHLYPMTSAHNSLFLMA